MLETDSALEVVFAMYASNNQGIDVTDTVRQAVLPPAYTFKPGNEFFGSDPDPGHRKYCLVVVRDLRRGPEPSYYAYGAQEGSSMTILPKDGDLPLIHSPGPARRASRHKIYYAAYANRIGGLHVAASVQALENSNVDTTEILAAPATLGYDFSIGQEKYLFICFGEMLNPSYKACANHDTLTIAL